MREKIGEWFIVEDIMDTKQVKQVLEFQKHGDHSKFGQIALRRQFINGHDLNKWFCEAITRT